MKNSTAIITALFLLLFTSCKAFEYSESKDNSDNDNSVDNSYTDNRIDNSVNEREPNDGGDGDTNGGNGDGINPDCSAGTNTVDGGGGFLVKPVSDSDGNLVVLFPSEYDIKFLRVTIIDAEGNIEDGNFTAFGNGSRQHWRFDKPGASYVGPITTFDEGQECTWDVDDYSVRQD